MAFDGDNCVEKVLVYCLKLKGQERKNRKNKILEYNLQLHAYNGSGFDTWFISNNVLVIKELLMLLKM